ncbi:MAG: zinc metalloprotease HtpX [Holophagaceae bacterium]|nr:zinc metalloprotease HtpX [Holophagaceae bacterium]
MKTFILIALMTGLLVLIGDLLYGQVGIIMALVAGILLNGFAYFFSDSIVLARYKAQIVTRESNPDLYAIVENLAQRAGLPMPRVAVVPEDTPNAFATGRNPNHAVVAVTQGIMKVLSRPELEGVLAHELAHVKNRDILIGSFSAVLSQAIMFLSRMAVYGGGRGKQQRSAHPFIIIAATILAPIAAILLQMAISRSREYLADEYAANITGRPDNLASALLKISGHNRQVPMRDAEPASAHLMIVSPLAGSAFASLFSTHPPIEKRVQRLDKIRLQMY